MNKVIEQIQKIGIIPVVVLDEVNDAVPLAEALIRGGLPCAEVTFRTEAAEEAIKIMSINYPEIMVGAGTILTIEQAAKANAAGAKFIVSPGFNPKVVKYCIDEGIMIIPGIATPSELEHALEMGINIVKFFPAEAAGGLYMIKAMSGPYTSVKFMPTGGINEVNVKHYLKFDKVIACGGSWMVRSDLIKEKQFSTISDLCVEAAEIVRGIRG